MTRGHCSVAVVSCSLGTLPSNSVFLHRFLGIHVTVQQQLLPSLTTFNEFHFYLDQHYCEANFKTVCTGRYEPGYILFRIRDLWYASRI